MICKFCEQEINDNAIVCHHCGCPTDNKIETVHTHTYIKNPSRRPMGVLFCFFFGLIGLIIGLIMYEPGSEERYTFKKGWWSCFLTLFIIMLVLSALVTVLIFSGFLKIGFLPIM